MSIQLDLGRVQPKKRVWTTGLQFYVLDFCEYNGSYYTCVTEHTSATENKPGVGAEWELISAGMDYQGNWVNQAYDFGSTVIYGGNSYLAIEQVSSGSGAPDNNASWQMIAAGVGAYKGLYSSLLAYEPGDFVYYRGSMYRANQGTLSGEKPTAYPAKWDTVSRGYNGPTIALLVPGDDQAYEVGDVIRFQNSTYVVLANLNSSTSNPQVTPNSFDLLVEGDKYMGNWQADYTYYPRDVVHYGNGLYKCSSYAISQADPRTANTFWEQLFDSTSYRGQWSENVQYYVGDFVTINSSSYICLTDHMGAEAQRPTAQVQTNWDLLAGGLQYDGVWSSAIEYDVGSVVTFNSQAYIANATVFTSESDPGQNSKWDVLASGFGQWEGDWDSATTYLIGQVVQYYGSLYRVSAYSTTQRPSSTASDWELLTRGNSGDIQDYPDLANGDSSIETIYEGQLVRWHGSVYRLIVASLDTSAQANNPSENSSDFTQVAFGFGQYGQWVTSRTYFPGDLVYRLNSTYQCTAKTIPNSDNPPESLPAKWEVWSVGQRYRGDHDGLASYFPGDIVTYSNSLYQCKVAIDTGNPSNTTYWDQIIEGPPVALPWNLASSGDSIRKSDGTTSVLREANGEVFLENVTLSGTVAIDAIPSGTRMIFQQTSAPVGWTKDTTHDNKALRVTSGTAASGGNSSFNTVFGITATNSHTLTAAQMPTHSHSTSTNGNHNHTSNMYAPASHNSGLYAVGHQNYPRGTASIPAAGNHSHNTNNAGSSSGHSHGIDLRVHYVDVIIAVKD